MVPGIVKTALAITGLCLFFSSVVSVSLVIDATQIKNCSCKGPTNYYKELGCTPVFKNSDDCCPVRYNCSVLINLGDNECLINGHVYATGESLRDEDRNPCDGECFCKKGSFSCPSPDCQTPSSASPDCHWLNDGHSCCGGRLVCLESTGTSFTCNVDGNTYHEGDLFVPSAEPEKRCHCIRGYTGENFAPYCKTAKHTWCRNAIFWGGPSIRVCAPVYKLGVSMETGCSSSFRCPITNDVMSRQTNRTSNELNYGTSEIDDPDMLCKLGIVTRRVGEELNNDGWGCMKCVCEVPPLLSCQYTCQDHQ